MIAQQLLGLVQELAFMLCAGSFITPSQLPQNLYPCRLTHCFIHSGHGKPTSGATYPFTALCTSSRVTKLLAQFATATRERISWCFGRHLVSCRMAFGMKKLSRPGKAAGLLLLLTGSA